MIASAPKNLPQERRDEPPVLLVTMPVSQKQRRLALAVLIAVVVAFLIALPYATIQLRRIDAFVPTIQAIIFVFELIVAILLFAQYWAVPKRRILVIANGYFFTALIVAAQAVTFPGAFAPSGLLYAGVQSASWLYSFWHTGFPIAVIFYALLKDADEAPSIFRQPSWAVVGFSISITIAAGIGVIWIATVGESLLPNSFGPTTLYTAGMILLVNIVAITLLWLRQRSLLDLWLMVSIFVTLPGFTEPIIFPLSAPIRFSVGWYLDRIYSLLGSGVVMTVLLTEASLLYARVVRSNIMLERERKNKLMNIQAASAAVAHEIAQPLAAIAIHAAAAKRFLEITPPRQDRAQTILGQIMDISRHAGDTLDGIRSLFRKGDLKRQLIDVNEIILDVLRSTELQLKDHAVVTRVELASRLPPVKGHRGQLQEVVSNLLHNAIEAMDLTADRSRLLYVRTKVGDGRIAVEVEDSGPGISQDKISDVFKAFVTTKGIGTGLGLAISQSIVEDHGGSISASSDGKSGALFEFSLPISLKDSGTAGTILN
jgi:signal transduction histidine kinase